MRDLNKVQIIGRLTDVPAMRFTGSGDPIARFRVEVRRPVQGDNATELFRCKAWGGLAEAIAQYGEADTRLYVEGRLQTERWTDQRSGKPREMFVINVASVLFLSHPNGAPPPDIEDEDVPF